LVDGKIAPALSGRFTPIEAISALLRGSGLRARLAGSSLIVERVPAPQDVSAEADGSDIVVTGTRIRGAGPVGSNVVTL
ncbi:STN domain-containing protein, partial [Klebsiella pneumoniae]|uniref:STN domain-containing protein n=1 Tax=Klebsiella pneumoniae TaxID=573 RepID=UPI003852EC4A